MWLWGAGLFLAALSPATAIESLPMEHGALLYEDSLRKPVGSPVTPEVPRNNNLWALLRLWHVESLELVIDHPNAVSFTRTSYITTPERWRQLTQSELLARIEQLLNASYNRRNYLTAQSGDTTRMVPFVFYFEWVERGDSPGLADAISKPWVLPKANAHQDLINRAFDEIDAKLRVSRPGIDSRAYRDAFSVFRIDEDELAASRPLR